MTTLRTERLTLRRDPEADTNGWVIEHDGVSVGVCHLRTSTELPGDVLECGWHLDREHRGSGLATEAVGAVLDHAHRTLGASAVFAIVHDGDRHEDALRTGFIDVGARRHDGVTRRVLVHLPTRPTGVHHVELWVADLDAAARSFGWLFAQLGWREYQRWPNGVSWRSGTSYVVVEDSPARSGDTHERTAPGINHLALHAGGRADVDRIAEAAPRHGWRLMFADRHPHAGGPDHYAAYLENAAGFEVELVAAVSE